MLATQKGERWRRSGNDEGKKQGGSWRDLPLLTSAQGPRIVEEILPAVAKKDRCRGCVSHYFGDMLMTQRGGGELL